jgi:hypothetical protein
VSGRLPRENTRQPLGRLPKENKGQPLGRLPKENKTAAAGTAAEGKQNGSRWDGCRKWSVPESNR